MRQMLYHMDFTVGFIYDILNSLIKFVEIPNIIRMFYSTSLLTES
jgi:hypothetical protein